MNTITVIAKRWSGGWELWHGDDCWTQVRHLKNAEQQVRDYLDTVEPELDHSNLTVELVSPEVAAFDESMAEEGRNIPWEEIKAEMGW